MSVPLLPPPASILVRPLFQAFPRVVVERDRKDFHTNISSPPFGNLLPSSPVRDLWLISSPPRFRASALVSFRPSDVILRYFGGFSFCLRFLWRIFEVFSLSVGLSVFRTPALLLEARGLPKRSFLVCPLFRPVFFFSSESPFP